MQLGLGDIDLTFPPSATLLVHVVHDVGGAAQEAVVARHTAPRRHPPVLGAPHENHVTRGAGGVEVFRGTVVAHS